MRALTDWYYTAHPPIMHDLHESMSLIYTYSGGPPQNPNLDPILFAELPWFSSWELAQMTKWGMPGVYTFTFMDGWSPGYLGSVAYNHNGIMKMYETQSGPRRTPLVVPAGPAHRRLRRQAAVADGAPDQSAASSERRRQTAGQAARGKPDAPCGSADRRRASSDGREARACRARRAWIRRCRPDAVEPRTANGSGSPGSAECRGVIQPSRQHELHGDRRSLVTPAHGHVPQRRRGELLHQVEELHRGRQDQAALRLRHSRSAGHDEGRRTGQILRIQGIEIGVATGEFKAGGATYPAGSYVIKRDQPYGRLAKNLLEKQVYPDARLTTYDDSGWTMGLEMMVDVKEIADAAILRVPTTAVKQVSVQGKMVGGGTAGVAVAHYGSNNMIAFRYRLRTVPMRIAEKSFKAEGIDFPAGSFILSGALDATARAAVEDLGLTAAALSACPRCRPTIRWPRASRSIPNGPPRRIWAGTDWHSTIRDSV